MPAEKISRGRYRSNVMDSAIWGLIGTVIGALSSIGTTWLASLSSHKLQNEKEKADRAERARAFQRELLLDLQEAIHDTFRVISKAYLEDRKAFAGGCEWGRNLIPNELAEEVRLAQRKVAILVERVADDSLRCAIKATMARIGTISLADSFNEAEKEFLMLMSEATGNNEQLGSLLRSHY